MSCIVVGDSGNPGPWSTAGYWPQITDLTTRTVAFWAGWGDGVVDAAPEIGGSDFNIVGRYGAGPVVANWRVYYHGNTDTLRIEAKFGTTNGVWSASVNGNGMRALDRGTFIAITYDSSSTANDPVFYSSGSDQVSLVSRAVTEVVAPAGSQPSPESGVTTKAWDSSMNENTYCFSELRVYNRILTADEIHNLWRARGRNRQPNGLALRLAPRAKALGVDLANLTYPDLNTSNGGMGVPNDAGIWVQQNDSFVWLNINPPS